MFEFFAAILAELGLVVGDGTDWKRSKVLLVITIGFVIAALFYYLFS